ncbi:DNA internalization-related competence protein ComEC/Rec2 [Planococcus salinus]|nr:DNA internalization-related competence protein ComEC/Rec2 [Planococcus salinus]
MLWKKEPASFMLLILLAAIAVYMLQDFRQQDDFPYEKAFTGELSFDSDYVVDGDRLRGFARLDGKTRVYATYRFETAEEKAAVEQMAHKSNFQVTGLFEVPSPPSHRFSFDMEKHLKKNGASHILAIDTIHAATEKRSAFGKLIGQRKAVQHHIREHFPAALTAEAEALLIGERETMTEEDRLVYQTLGITHLFAISGLHVGIVSGMLYFLLIRLHIRKETAILLLLVALPMYAVVAGGAPSVWRAVSMVLTVLVASLFGARLPIAQVLLLSLCAFVLLDPYVMYQIGFQLSYGASFGIIYSIRFLSASQSLVKTGFLVTCIAQLSLYPLLLFYFYELSVSAFFVNSIFVPLYTMLILPVNFILLFLTWAFPPAADLIFHFYEPLRSWIGGVMEWLSFLPFQMWNPGKPEPLVLALLIATVLLFYSLAEQGFKYRQLLILLLPAAAFSLWPYADPALKVTFLDVGQGDSAVVELPYRRAVYLIDTGGVLRFDAEEFKKRQRPYEVGRQVVAPYLKGKGISTIDALILSHPDADHAEGADEIFRLFRVKELHATPGSAATDLMKALSAAAKEADIHYPGKGSEWEEGGIQFSYWAPEDTEYEGNNDSLVLKMEKEAFSVLFTGDLEVAGENKIVERHKEELRGTTILKVGHHGSKTSSGQSFLEAASPKLSIFSTGKDNRYGHPTEEVVERFQSLGLPTLNTAESGTIEIEYENGAVSVQTMR